MVAPLSFEIVYSIPDIVYESLGIDAFLSPDHSPDGLFVVGRGVDVLPGLSVFNAEMLVDRLLVLAVIVTILVGEGFDRPSRSEQGT